MRTLRLGFPVLVLVVALVAAGCGSDSQDTQILTFDTYSQCAEALGDNRVQAVTTDNTILAGLIQQSSGKFKLVGAPFSQEPYGIGLKKGDDAFRAFLNDQLARIEADGQWAEAFASTLGKLGLPTPAPPPIDRYAPAGGPPSSAPAPAVPTFPEGTAMAAIQAKGNIVVGTKFDQPGFGLKNPTTGQVEGFDVDIAKLMAVGIFGGTEESVSPKVEFVEAVSRNREPFIQNETVDIVVATYTITPTRKEVVDFAGPYFVAQQDIMVEASDNSIKTVTDLNGKTVCTVKGSTSEKNVRKALGMEPPTTTGAPATTVAPTTSAPVTSVAAATTSTSTP